MENESDHSEHERVDFHLHLPETITINLNINLTTHPPDVDRAARGAIVIHHPTGEPNMSGTITVDTTGEVATATFTDDHGDTDARLPDGTVLTFATDNPAAATVDPSTGAITPLAEGTGNVTATATNPDGSPLMAPDGTPFQITPAPFTIGPGPATSGLVVVSNPATP